MEEMLPIQRPQGARENLLSSRIWFSRKAERKHCNFLHFY